MINKLKYGESVGEKLKSYNNGLFNLSMTTYASNRRIEKHYHDNSYLSILVKGKYTEHSQRYQQSVMAGDILFRPSSYTHENQFQECGGTCFHIEFNRAWIEKIEIDLKLKLPQNFVHFKSGVFPSLYKLLFCFQYGQAEDLANEFLYDWLFQINQIPAKQVGLQWVEKVIQILDNELYEFHSLKSLSERVYVHPVYLARGFKERKGCTIGEFQLKAKLANAIHLLLNTSLSIKDISYQNGFYDDAHFIRSFNTVYHISPQKFRLTLKS